MEKSQKSTPICRLMAAGWMSGNRNASSEYFYCKGVDCGLFNKNLNQCGLINSDNSSLVNQISRIACALETHNEQMEQQHNDLMAIRTELRPLDDLNYVLAGVSQLVEQFYKDLLPPLINNCSASGQNTGEE